MRYDNIKELYCLNRFILLKELILEIKLRNIKDGVVSQR